jgi:hypothetical protein
MECGAPDAEIKLNMSQKFQTRKIDKIEAFVETEALESEDEMDFGEDDSDDSIVLVGEGDDSETDQP